MSAVLEPAASGRAKCRGCGQTLPKGELRFGERVPNPFGDGEATYWFHPWCAAARRPEVYLELEHVPETLEDAADLEKLAQVGRDHYRLARIEKLERAPSGRARCRHCKELIEKGAPRIGLSIWEEGRFSGMGNIHLSCAEAYFGTPETVETRLRFVGKDLEDLDAILED